RAKPSTSWTLASMSRRSSRSPPSSARSSKRSYNVDWLQKSTSRHMKTRSRFRKNLNVSGVFLCGFLCLLVAGLIGCHRGPIVPTDLNPAPIEGAAELPDYAELVGRYNANAAALERVFARTKVELRWRDDKGRPRRESGDGRLI